MSLSGLSSLSARAALAWAACLAAVPFSDDPAAAAASRRPARLASPRSLAAPGVVRIHDVRPSRLASLARLYDLWEVRREEGYAVALLAPADYDALLREGVTLEVDLDRTEAMLSLAAYPCYSDVDGLNARMDAIAAARPGIAEVIDIGDSVLGEDLRLLRLTNRSPGGPKPVLFVMAAIHAREMTTSEVAMAFAQRLADGYGDDADATWLLDHHEIHILPVANPDGRRLADAGLYQRKNLNDANGGSCAQPPTPTNQFGTDLNRNYSFNWACCGGSSPNPCAQTFRGALPASEPETAAVQAWLASVFPDQRPADRVTPAPLDATGVAISLHSYSRLVMWPWGDSFGPAPNGADLALIGGKLASWNGYTATQASGLYITDGITDDWVYGALGVAAFTFELGDDFFEDCALLPGTLQDNLPALDYAARIARAPYRLARGPDALSAAVSAAGVRQGEGATLTASFEETWHGGEAVAGARYYIDLPPWQGGSAVPMQAVDGLFDGVTELATASVDTGLLSSGRHIIFVEGFDASGNAGAVRAVFLHVYPQAGVPVTGLDAADGTSPGSLLLTWEALGSALSYRVAAGSLAAFYSHTLAACGVTEPLLELAAAPEDAYFLVEAMLPGPWAGGFGDDSTGQKRPPAAGSCP